ncbi:MAG: PqqD family protein [Minwuia sp.]|nr:PqqD family protein [Minwuia sp.]
MRSWERVAGVSENPMDDDLFLVAPISGEIVHLDRLGAAIWRLLEQPQVMEDIQAVFAAAFPDSDATTLQGDLLAALETLKAAGLVRQSDG